MARTKKPKKTQKAGGRKRASIITPPPSAGEASSQGRLPSELVSKVLANLDAEKDRKTLARCMRVSPAFNEIAGPRLYHTITIRPGMRHHPLHIPTSRTLTRSTKPKTDYLDGLQGLTIRPHDGPICDKVAKWTRPVSWRTSKVKWIRVEAVRKEWSSSERLHRDQDALNIVGCHTLANLNASYAVLANCLPVHAAPPIRRIAPKVFRIISVIDMDKRDYPEYPFSRGIRTSRKPHDEVVVVLCSSRVDYSFSAQLTGLSPREMALCDFLVNTQPFHKVGKKVTLVNVGTTGEQALKAKLRSTVFRFRFRRLDLGWINFITMKKFLETYETDGVFTPTQMRHAQLKRAQESETS